MANRHLLAVQQIDNLKNWLIKNGWTIEKIKGEYEVLRARKGTEKLPLIVYKRSRDNLIHLSVSDWNARHIKEFIEGVKKMKKLLFRLYDNSQEKMIYSYELNDEEQPKREFVPFWFEIGFSHFDKNDFSYLMQHTGLYDRDDNDIFEGDIVEFENWYAQDGNGGERHYECELLKGRIMFELGAFGLVREQGDIIKLFEFAWNDHFIPLSQLKDNEIELRVIGNIFENPELLKGLEL